MILKFCERTSPIGPLHHELHVLKDGQFCTPGSTPGVQVANLGAPRAETETLPNVRIRIFWATIWLGLDQN